MENRFGIKDFFLFLLLVFFEVWARSAYGVSFLVNAYNLQSIAQFAALPLLLALGQTFVIIAGGIDLSVGFVMGLAAVVMARVMQELTPVSPGLALAAGLLAALIAALVPGLINGTLISRLKVPPFIGTLGMYGVAGRYLGQADHLPIVAAIGRHEVWVALAAWALTLAALLVAARRVAGDVPVTRRHRS